MRRLTEGLLRELAACDAPLCLSLYLEVAPGGGDHHRIRIALKNAKAAAEEALARDGADAGSTDAVRDRLSGLDYEDVVGSPDGHVAVFIAPELTEIVAAALDEKGVHCGPRFRLAPLIAALDQTPDHAILVATEKSSCLYEARTGALKKVKVDGMPESLAEIAKFTETQEKGNVHGRETSGVPVTYRGRQAMVEGQPGMQGVPHQSIGGHDWRQDMERDLRQYANLVVNAVGRHLGGSGLPLVLAADERLHGMMRENSEYPFLAREGITAHPGDMDEERLRREAAACLARAAEARRAEAWDKVAQSLGRGDRGASEDPAEIAGAAAAGRVAHLFARAGARLPGRFDRASLSAEPAEDGPEDLVDLAIVETLRNGGDVLPLGDRGSGASPLAAAYRYPA